MEKYATPELKVVVVSDEDVIRTSGAGYDTQGEDIEWGGFFI